MKYFITVVAILISSISIAQVAVINDPDGYTNVREKPDSQSKILYKLKANQVFWYGQEDYQFDSVEWILVAISKNNYSLECGSLDHLLGYVHRSRIKPLDTLKEYIGSDLMFKYVTKPFSEENKIIDYRDQWIIAINGLHPWGADGNLPKTEIEKINITVNGQKVAVPEVLTSDIYECDNSFKVYKIEQTFFIHQWNSDGAGAYEIVWVITENDITQRLVGTIL